MYDTLAGDPRYRVRPVVEHFARNERDAQAVNVCIRHDVDIALEFAAELAEYEAAIGIRSTYYFLTDTAPYRIWESDIPRRVAALGHEVGVHSDHHYEQLALERDGIARLHEDVVRMAEHAGVPVHGIAWHGGKHIAAYKANNYDLYKDHAAADLGLEYHDSVFYQPDTRKWRCDHILSDGENSLRFVPGKPRAVLGAAARGEDVLVVAHPFMMMPPSARPACQYPDYPHLSPPRPRNLHADLKSCLAYNKPYLGPRRTEWLRRAIRVVERFGGGAG
ncbi:MAG: hypothetical protein AB8G96_04545 [Phycisphaerales bacterium]